MIKKEVKENILFKYLIGKTINIIKSKNKFEIGLNGVVVFESQTLFHIELNNKEIKKIKKNHLSFEIKIENDTYLVKGNLLKNTLINRIKKSK